MDANTTNLIINLLASVIFYLIGVITTLIFRHFFILAPIRRIWGLKDPKEGIHIAVTSLDPQQAAEYQRPTTGLGELEALGFVRESLALAYGVKPDVHTDFSSSFPDSGYGHNIVCIGGAKYNQITREFVNSFPSMLTVLIDGNNIASARDTITTQGYLPEFLITEQGTRKITLDYGVLTRMPNPNRPEKFVLILRGVHTYGVAGLGQILTPPFLKQLSDAIKKSNSPYWQALISVRVQGAHVFPHLVLFRPLPEDLFERK